MINTVQIRKAIKTGDLTALEIMSKDNVNLGLPKGWSPLHLAAKFGHEKIALFLLSRGAHINAESELRQTPLDIAVVRNHLELAKLLEKQGAKHGYETSLHGAALAGNLAWVKKHLASGADINGRSNGELPLCLALARHHWQVGAFLLKKKPDVNKAQDNGDMALHEAAHAAADETLMEAILKLGADVNAVGCWDLTPLCWAARAGHEDTVKFLIRHGADVRYRTADGRSPVAEAVHERHRELARLLIENGAKSTLHHAVQCGHLRKARELLSEGADVGEKDDRWIGPAIDVAIYNDSVEMVELLLEFGAEPNAQNRIVRSAEGAYGGNTPLHSAVAHGSAKIVKLLLRHGADPDVQNAQGLNPLELAKRRDQTHLVHVMEAHIDRQLSVNAVEQLYTIHKVAELLSVDEQFVVNLLRDGKLRQIKLDGETVRIPAGSLTRYLSALVK